jgi:hypothetical protein
MLNIKVSAFTGAGIDSFRDALAEIARNGTLDNTGDRPHLEKIANA